jgi:hypothetical protein
MKDYNSHVEWKPASVNPFTVALIAVAFCALILSMGWLGYP